MGSLISNPQPGDFARLYALLIQNLTDFAIFLMDTRGVITSWNRGVERNLGYAEAEFVGQPVAVLFTPEDIARGAPRKEIDIAARDGRATDARWHVRKDGSRLFVDGVLSALRSPEGELLGFSKVMRDSTHHYLLQQQLERSNRELSQFAHVVSHDLQAPLRTVSVYIDLLLRACGDQPSQEIAAYVDFIRDGVGQMQTLIRDLLNYAQIRPANDFRAVPLEGVLEQVVAGLHAAIAENGATVTHDPLPMVLGEETRLHQLFQNLIGNAIKYRGPEPPRIHVSARARDHSWVLSVRDNGIGIEPEHAVQIFEPLTRLHGREFPGTGIGLAICKRIVEQHGGAIWVQSKPGEGATFYFTMPGVE